uniref:Uncharacterized protein n=1 Tax=Anguilla anguilla TaxID=7936 RepID=A0A0E9TCK7_ANGAN
MHKKATCLQLIFSWYIALKQCQVNARSCHSFQHWCLSGV